MTVNKSDTSLPSGWVWFRIEKAMNDESFFCDGDWIESKDQDPNGEVRLIQLADIGDGHFIDKSSRYLTSEKSNELGCTFLKKGDLLVARLGEPLGKSCIFPLEGDENHVTAVDVCIIRLPEAIIDTKYLMNIINSPNIRTEIDKYKSGSTRKRISRKNLARIYFPLAPFQEQHRIVSKIEELFSDLDNGIEQLKTAQKQLAVYRQAVLKWAFEGKLTKAWREKNKPELAEKLLEQIQLEREKKYQEQLDEWKQKVLEWEDEGRLGRRPTKPKEIGQIQKVKCDLKWESSIIPNEWVYIHFENVICNDLSNGKSAKNKDNGIPILKLNAIKNGIIDIKEQKLGDLDNATASKYYIQKNDFLISRGNGSKDLVGRAGLVIENSSKISFPDTMIRAEIIPAICLHHYLKYLWDSPVLRSQVENKAHTTAGIYKINQQHIKNFIIPLPSINEQQAVIREIESRLLISEQVEKDIRDAMNKSEALRQSILKKAFEGKLVPQDPNDEPASELLKRIQAEKKSTTPKKTKNKKAS